MLTKPFSTVVEKGGQKFRRFDFPTDAVIGLIRTEPQDQDVLASGVTAEEQSVPASGVMQFPISEHICFSPSEIVGRYPDCLKRFRPADIYSIRFYPEACTDEIFKAALNLSDIRELSVDGCHGLTDASYATLSGFHSLASFDASNSNLEGPQLAQAGCWGRLENLTFASANHIVPLLHQLQDTKLLRKISLTRSVLTAEDFQALAALPQITHLDLTRVKMTRHDLFTLSALKSLTELRLGETALDGSDLDLIQNFKSLTCLDFSGNQITKKDLTHLITMGDFAELDLERTDLDASIVDVLKNYKSLKRLRINSELLKPGEFDKIKQGLPLVKVS